MDDYELIRMANICGIKLHPNIIQDDSRRHMLIEMQGFTPDALNDSHYGIRLAAYKILGWTKKAFKDRYWIVRLEAYRALGFTKDALEDGVGVIQSEAEEYFTIVNNVKNLEQAKIDVEAEILRRI